MAIDIPALLGDKANDLLNHECKTISKNLLHLPSPTFADDIFSQSDRSTKVIASLKQLFNHGHLKNTGYLSILPVDQGIEHSAGASFAPNPIYFDPENIVKLAIEGGCNGNAIKFGKTSPLVYEKLTTNHPIDLTRYQVANCYMGRAGLINSGSASGKDDLRQVIRTAVINKRAGGTGLICGRKSFQKTMKEGINLLNAIQDVYLDKIVTIA